MIESHVYMESMPKNESIPLEVITSGQIERKALEGYLAHANQKLGSGNFARVVTREGDSFCVKDFKPEVVFDAEKEELLREFYIQEKLSLQNARVPKPLGYQYVKESGRYRIIMETVNGYSLDDFRLGRAELANDFDPEIFFSDTESKLRYIHQIGIIHGDLNIGNVMRDSNTGEAVIIDFGQSRDSNLAEGQAVSDMSAREDFEELERTKGLFMQWYSTARG